MKAVKELILHFYQRGALTLKEIDYLVLRGFASKEELSELTFPRHMRNRREHGQDGFPSELDQREEELLRESELKAGRRGPRTPPIEIKELLARVRLEFERREESLQSLSELLVEPNPMRTWQQTASELHALSPLVFEQQMVACLRRRPALVRDVWRACNPESFYELIGARERRGGAVRAFLALLRSAGPEELGSYSWILRHDEAQAIINIRVIYERLLATLANFFQHDRQLRDAIFEQSHDAVLAWSQIILFNAQRSVKPPEFIRFGLEFGPVLTPEFGVWKQAWSHALRMDGRNVSRYFLECFDEKNPTHLTDEASCALPLMCPVGWRVP